MESTFVRCKSSNSFLHPHYVNLIDGSTKSPSLESSLGLNKRLQKQKGDLSNKKGIPSPCVETKLIVLPHGPNDRGQFPRRSFLMSARSR